MNRRYVIGLVLVIGLCLALSGPCFAQSNRCVILELRDNNTALVSCEGGAAQVMDFSGKSSLYKAGDSIDVPRAPGSAGRGTGVPNDPRSSTGGASRGRTR